MRASSSARSRLPRCAPWRRTITARSPHGDAVLDVDAAQLARDRRVLLGGVRRDPRRRTHGPAGRSVRRARARSRAAPGNASVANRSSGTRVVPWNENTCASGSAATTRLAARRARQQRLGRERRVLVVVDEHVVEQRRAVAGDRRAQLHEPRIVNLIDHIERVEVLLREAGELVPAAEPGARPPPRASSFGRPQRLLHPGEQLAHLVGEPADRRGARRRRATPRGSCAASSSRTFANCSAAPSTSGGSPSRSFSTR